MGDRESSPGRNGGYSSLHLIKAICLLKQNMNHSGSYFNARQQALSMAEKRVHTEYNEMIYEMSKIISKKNIRLAWTAYC